LTREECRVKHFDWKKSLTSLTNGKEVYIYYCALRDKDVSSAFCEKLCEYVYVEEIVEYPVSRRIRLRNVNNRSR
jgi:hypothetical protein